MAQELYRFFNSATGDERSYEADDLAAAFRCVSMDGVAALTDSCLKVTAEGSTMRTLVSCGSALVRGYHYELRDDGGAQRAYTHAGASGNDRIDRIVVRLDLDARTIALAKKEGAAAASPVPPALTRTGSVWELSLAQVRVRDGATALLPADVTDERADEGACGAALPEGAKLSALWARMPKQNAGAGAAGLMSAADKQALDALNAALSPNAQAQTLGLGGYVLTGGDMRYGEDGTVSAAIAANTALVAALRADVENDAGDAQIHVYAHSRSDAGVHNFTGTGANGRVKITAQVQSGDTFTVNGLSADAYISGLPCDELPVGRWITFVYTPAVAAQGQSPAENAQVNFKSGGWGKPGFRLLFVNSADELTPPPSLPYGFRSTVALVMGEEPASVSRIGYDACHDNTVIYPQPWIARRILYLVEANEGHAAAAGTAYCPRFLGRGGAVAPYEALYDGTSGFSRTLTRVPAYTWNGAAWVAWAGNGGGA